MSKDQLQPWLRKLKEHPNLAATAVTALVLTVALVPYTLAAIPNPSGPSAQAVMATHNGGSWFSLSAQVYRTQTYDITFNNLPAQGFGYGYGYGSTGWRLYDPFGAVASGPRDGYSDPDNLGKVAVTFPSMTFSVAGTWSLRADNFATTSFEVSAPALVVTHRPPSPVDGGTVEIFVNASPGGPLAGVELAIIRNGTHYVTGYTDSTGRYVLIPAPAGTYSVYASKSGYASSSDSFTVSTVPNPVATFSIGNVSAGPVIAVAKAIRLDNVTNFGAATLNMSFDPAIADVVTVSPGNIPGATTTWSVNNSTGLVSILVTTNGTAGPSGSFVFANVSFRAAGVPGATTTLDLAAAETVRPDGSAIPATAVDGTFRSGLLGDVTGDGILTVADYAALSEYVVGLRTSSQLTVANADTNRDGRVTGVDAMFLDQYLAGTRSSL